MGEKEKLSDKWIHNSDEAKFVKNVLFLLRSHSVWPDVGIRSSPNSSNVAKSSHNSLN